MPKFEGDWFHSRTGSQLSELAAIQLLVASSQKTKFIGKHWGADRKNSNNAWIYEFSATAKLGDSSIKPSTMQTKIRNWIRLGFLMDTSTLPLQWTTLGLLWEDAINDGRGEDANLLYRLIIANSLATVSFSENSKKFDSIPHENGLVVRRLIEEINRNNGSVDKKRLEFLIDGETNRVKGKNYSYWVTDLVQSSLFSQQDNASLIIGNQFCYMITAIANYVPDPNITTQEIKDNPLALGAPFREALLSEFADHGSPQLISAVEDLSRAKMTISQIKINKLFSRNKQLERTSSWSKSVKDNYKYHCAIPGCDSEGTLFIEAAHIMPFSAENTKNGNQHRNDVENGMALCLSCHKMFDAGLFTFDKNGNVITSKFIYSSKLINTDSQTNVIRILDSEAKSILLPDSVNFNEDYALYHKENVFLGE